MLPGVFLWKDVGLVIHTVDSRVLDDLVIRGRYSPALTFGSAIDFPVVAG
jgi:hypothetical protein